jgi:hypothetical protein
VPGSKEYREKATECVAAAEGMREPEERIAMLAIAQAFLRVADYVGNHASVPVHGRSRPQ